MPLPLRRYVAVLAVVVGVVALSAEIASADGARCERCAVVNSQALQVGTAERVLAEKYVPIVYVRNQIESCDTRGSPYVPVPVEFLFDVDAIVLRKHESGRTTDEVRAPSGADLYGKDDTYFLDFPGDPKRPGCRFERDFLARVNEYTPTAYAHIAYEDGRDGFALQYWLFYYFNHWNNTHEGDWEMIQLTFEGPTPADALTQEPTGVGYSQHGSGERSDWDDAKLSKEGTHPIAFAAAGANANQFEPNVILGRGENGTGFGCDDARRPNRRVPLAVQLMEEPSSASDPYPWLAFDGRWGERAPWEFNGPTGPNDKRAWREPFLWQENLRPSSIIVPSGDTLGPNAVNLFCDVVWYLSAPFAQLIRLPRGVLVAGVVLGLSGTGFLMTRTSYRPVMALPLRRRRRFGQALSASARLYRRNVVLFIGIGAIFIPVSIIESAFQWVLFSTTPYVATISGFFAANRAVEAIIALGVGNATSSLVYWFVTVGVTAAIGRVEAGQSSSALAAFRDVLRQAPALIVPRLRALVIFLILALSVVGLPWAVRNWIRWAFIEQSILLDGTPSRESLAASAGAVDGSWWHTSFCLTTLWVVAYLSGPTVALLLLLLSPVSVATVNLTSSVIFAAVAPFVAICQTLLYFDLRAKADLD